MSSIFLFIRRAGQQHPAVAKALGANTQRGAGLPPVCRGLRRWDEVAALKPDLTAVAALDLDGVFVTAPGRDGVDYVARYFAPGRWNSRRPRNRVGSQCILMPYWASRLGRKRLRAAKFPHALATSIAKS